MQKKTTELENQYQKLSHILFPLDALIHKSWSRRNPRIIGEAETSIAISSPHPLTFARVRIW
jgi:hypothetical protein